MLQLPTNAYLRIAFGHEYEHRPPTNDEEHLRYWDREQRLRRNNYSEREQGLLIRNPDDFLIVIHAIQAGETIRNLEFEVLWHRNSYKPSYWVRPISICREDQNDRLKKFGGTGSFHPFTMVVDDLTAIWISGDVLVERGGRLLGYYNGGDEIEQRSNSPR